MDKHLNNNWLIELEDFDGYFVNEEGGVFSEHRGLIKQIKGGINPKGYFFVNLRKNKITYQARIHRLVIKTFIPNPNNKPCCDHINRVRTDNRVENLRWATISENGRNCSIRSDNTSKITGVRFDEKANSWRVEYITSNHIKKSKRFSVNKLGSNAKQLAIDFRLEMEQKYYTFN